MACRVASASGPSRTGSGTLLKSAMPSKAALKWYRLDMRRLALTLVIAFATPAAADVAGTPRIVDGDTLEIAGQDVRLHGIDAPESRQKCKADGKRYPCGRRATQALRELIHGRQVRCEQTDTDRYGRIVAICYGPEGTDLNGALVAAGWALAYRRYSTRYVDEEAAARDAGRGLWRGEFVPPWDWRRGERLSGATVFHGDTDRDCADFDSWEAAQRFYEEAGPGDPHRLDGDGDGEACEGLR